MVAFSVRLLFFFGKEMRLDKDNVDAYDEVCVGYSKNTCDYRWQEKWTLLVNPSAPVAVGAPRAAAVIIFKK